MAKECMGPLVPAIRVLWETAEKTWQRSFALFVAVKHCGRFIKKENQFYTSKATESDQLAGGFEFYFINLAENQSYCLCNYRGVKSCS